MRFLVLGAGALGGYFGGKLLQGGAQVDFLVRPKRATQLAERGLVVKEPAGEFAAPVKTLAAGEIAGPYDVVFLACKAYHLDSAIEAIAPAVGARSAIFPVLNGINHIDRLVERFGAEHVLGGMTIVNAALTPDGDVVRPPTSLDGTKFGELSGERSPRCKAKQW
jgi:2-dehydropantoate 2-reductase